MGYTIRTLTIDDYDLIIRLWSDAGLPFKPKGRDSLEMMSKEMALSQVQYFGMFDSDKMIGVGIGNYDGRRGWVNRVSIDPEYRGEHLASRIIAECETFLRDSGAVVICALIDDENSPSMACFTKAGFQSEPSFIYWTRRDSSDS